MISTNLTNILVNLPSARTNDGPDINADGSLVVFRSVAANNQPNIYLYNRTNGTTTLITQSVNGPSPADFISTRAIFSRIRKRFFSKRGGRSGARRL